MSGLPEKPRRSLTECLGILRLFGAPVLTPRPTPDAATLAQLAQDRDEAVQMGQVAA